INDPEFNELTFVRPQLPDFSKLLTPTTALIEWYLPPDPDLGAYAFVVTLRDNQPHIELHPYTAAQRQALDAFNQAYFADFRQPRWYNNLATRLHDLAQILDLASLIELLPQPCQSLILIPHLYLHLFPLHALPVVKDSETLPWQETIATGIRYAPSSQILDYIHNRPQNTTAPQFFAIQNPTEDLPYTDLEIDTIRRNFDPNSYILSHAEATKTALNAAENLAQLRQSRLVHFACHGGFDSENPLNSALILAGDTATPAKEGRSLTLRDGRRFDTSHQGLTLREIYANLELRACRLVILSACETGLLSSQLTDEYIGLASGFLYAGSPSVISSLWCVDDFATAFLTIRFYQEFTPTTPTAQAAKAAQSWMRQVSQADFLKWLQNDLKLPEKAFRNCRLRLRRRYKTNPPFSNPMYWSAFGAIGL
ncbi:MAG: CHAT domain-containing protein, partial [Spirulinaceae cyanobacterium]